MGFGKKRSNKVGVGAITTNKKKLFVEGGMMDDGKNVDPVSGNDVPVGSLAEEVRDDVDAKLSPGEFVFPADVVRFIGLERLMQMRDQAKKGLMRMNDIGQMGNAEEVGEEANSTYEEDDDFESNIDEVMSEVNREETGRQTEMAFNTGGFVNPSYYDITKAPKNPALDIRYFKDGQGKDFYMPFINGKPMNPMPNGATQSSGPPPKTSTGGGAGSGIGAGAGIGIGTGTTSTGTTSTQQQQISDAKDAGAAGVYTGSNLADFGRADMIYNPGGSGPSGEIMTEDLWTSSISNLDVKLGTTVLSALASAMGVPGILTLPLRLAVNKFGADKVNAWLGEANRQTVARGAGIDPSTPEGMAAAASLVDRTVDRTNTTAAATPGAIGTGSVAAQASSAVADSLKNSGLSDAEIGQLSQRAADAVVRGVDKNTAVNSAKSDADALIQEKITTTGLGPITMEDPALTEITTKGLGPITMEDAAAVATPTDAEILAREKFNIIDSFDNFDTFNACPAPWTKIMLEDKQLIQAKDLLPGMRVWTQHEHSGEWGAYTVSAVSMAKADRSKLSLDDGRELVATFNHRVKTPNGWVEIQNLNNGDKIVQENGFATVKSVEKYDYGDVVKITVEDAHTYLTEGFLSHNIKKESFDFWGDDALFGDFGGWSGGGGGGSTWDDRFINMYNK